MSFDPNQVSSEHIDALADLLKSSPALQQAVGVTSTGAGRLDSKKPKGPAPTYGHPANYRPKEFPKALHSSRTEFVVVRDAAEEELYLAQGFQRSPYDFAPEEEAVDELALLKQQVAMLTQRLATVSDKDLESGKKSGKRAAE